MLVVHQSEATETSKNSIHGGISIIKETHDEEITENNDRHMHVGHDPLSHMQHQMDPSVIVFFLLDNLKKGTSMQIYFPKREKIGSSSSTTPLLTKEEADRIPFSSKYLPELLQRYRFSHGSPQAIAMENALRQCEIEPIKGETKFCATSIESMLEFAQKIFGLESHVETLSTRHLTALRSTLQRYIIAAEPQQIWAPKTVACHTMPYPYAVFYCHYQESESRVYRVHLVAEHGDEVEAIAVCHMDTSQWSPHHVSFRILGTKPGASPICHFFPADHLVLVPDYSSVSIAVA